MPLETLVALTPTIIWGNHGVKLIDQIPRDGLSGQIAFIHPKSTRGVLVELVDKSSTVRGKKC